MNKFSFPGQNPHVHRSIAILGLAISVGTTGTLIYETQDDLQAQTVPTKLSPVSTDRGQVLFHQVQSGDTLWKLSKTYNLDAAVIASANNISAVTPLEAGSNLIIPPTEGVIHHVKADETLDQIAEFYDVKVEDIAKFSPEVKADQPIVVPGDITTLLSIRAEDAKNRLIAEKEELKEQLALLEESATYKVKPGDTVEDLAIKFKTSKAEIIALNQLENPDFLALGQELAIPGLKPVSSSSVELPKFIPTISQEIGEGNRTDLIALAAQFGILPTGGESPTAPIQEEKIAALPVKEEPLPIVAEVKAPIQEEKIAALPVKEEPLPIVAEVKAPIQEEKIAALPVKEEPLPIVAEVKAPIQEEKIAVLPETQAPIQSEKIASLPTEKPTINPDAPTKVAALTTIEIVRQPSAQFPSTTKTPELPPLPKTEQAKPSSPKLDGMPQKLAALNLSTKEQTQVPLSRNPELKPIEEQRMTAPAVKNLQQEVEKLRAELNNKQVQKVAAINPNARSGFVPSYPDLGRLAPELPPLNAANFLPEPSNYGLSDGFVWPASGIMTSGFGWRWGRLHQGIDIAAPVGTPIWAAASGVVQFAGWNDGGYGYMIDILHANGTVTRYAHMNALYVKAGQRVQQSQVIGEMGSTGYSTGPHLHFEVRPNGGVATNPMTYLAGVPRSRSAS